MCSMCSKKFYLTGPNERLSSGYMTSPGTNPTLTETPTAMLPEPPVEYTNQRPVQVFDWRGRHLYDTTVKDANERRDDEAGHYTFIDTEKNVYHFELVKRIAAPSWIFGTRYTFSVRTEAGMVVHAPHRANASRIPTASHVRDLVEWGASVLPIDRERLAMRLEWPKLAALVLHEAWGYSQDEISQILNVPRRSVARHIVDALTTLRKIISC